MSKLLSRAIVAVVCSLLFQGCAEPPDDLKFYCTDELHLYQVTSAGWQTIYGIERTGPKLIQGLAYDGVNKRIAISLYDRIPVKRNAKILLVVPDTRKILNEINTGMDRILDLSFNRTGEIIAVLEKDYDSRSSRKLYILTLRDMSFQLLAEGDFQNIAFGIGNEIYLDYTIGDKQRVGMIDLKSGGAIADIAEGRSISPAFSRDSFIYIDPPGNVIYCEKGRFSKKLPIEKKFQDVRFLDSISYVYGSDDIIVSQYTVQRDNFFLLKPPYSTSTKICNRRCVRYIAVAARGNWKIRGN